MKKGLKIRRKGGFKPMSVIMKMTKESILYRIKEKLKTYSKKRLAVFYYNLLKNDLPQLRTIRQKALTGKYYLTKTGQPFIILPSGKALFISKTEIKGMRNAGKWDPVEVRTKRRKR